MKLLHPNVYRKCKKCRKDLPLEAYHCCYIWGRRQMPYNRTDSCKNCRNRGVRESYHRCRERARLRAEEDDRVNGRIVTTILETWSPCDDY